MQKSNPPRPESVVAAVAAVLPSAHLQGTTEVGNGAREAVNVGFAE